MRVSVASCLSNMLVFAFGGMSSLAQANPAVPRPEHPEPQAQRTEWLNLNGEWEFAESDEDTAAAMLTDAAYPDRITVPFCRESKLSGLERKGFVKHVWYRRTFEVPQNWRSPRVRLHIGACDWRTWVWVNGEPVGTHTGGNAAFAFDITSVLKTGTNAVVIHAFDDTRSGLQPLGKQSRREESHGIFYTRTTGIWQTVWLEGVGATFVARYDVDPDPAQQRILVNVALDGPVKGLTLRAEVTAEGKSVSMAEVPAIWRNNVLTAPVPKPRLWRVQDPFLYDLKLSLVRDGATVDEIAGYFGMRRVSIEGAAMLLNGEPVFQRLVLDQGFYPEGVWTAPSDAALRGDIELSQACGFNGARLHQKVFEPRFLYWADKLGYLVWGEYPSFGADYHNPAVNAPLLEEWLEIVQRDRNHPAVIGWCPFNETGTESGILQAAVVRATRAIDPSRPVIESSGYAHTIADPEVLDAHDYNQNPDLFRQQWNQFFSWRDKADLPARYHLQAAAMVPFFISEYGGIGWSIEQGGWGYGNTPENLEAFYTRFKGLADALLDNRFMFGLCYTQLTNVEQEQNGLYLYDRTPKFDVARLKAVLSRTAAYETDPPQCVAVPRRVAWKVLVGALQDGSLARPWRYTTNAPGEKWATPAFNDGKWSQGLAPFGHKGGEWQDKIHTKWNTADLWLRQEFVCENAAFDMAAIILHHDDAVEVYVNGTMIWNRKGWNDSYQAFDVTEDLRKALVSGKNLIAAHIRQDRGGQYIDLALLAGTRTAPG